MKLWFVVHWYVALVEFKVLFVGLIFFLAVWFLRNLWKAFFFFFQLHTFCAALGKGSLFGSQESVGNMSEGGKFSVV